MGRLPDPASAVGVRGSDRTGPSPPHLARGPRPAIVPTVFPGPVLVSAQDGRLLPIGPPRAASLVTAFSALRVPSRASGFPSGLSVFARVPSGVPRSSGRVSVHPGSVRLGPFGPTRASLVPSRPAGTAPMRAAPRLMHATTRLAAHLVRAVPPTAHSHAVPTSGPSAHATHVTPARIPSALRTAPDRSTLAVAPSTTPTRMHPNRAMHTILALSGARCLATSL